MKKAIVLLLCSVVSLFSANGQFHTSRFSEKVSPQNDIRAIAFDADGGVYVSTYAGIYHDQGGGWKLFSGDKIYIEDCMIDSGGTLWLSVWNDGVYIARGGVLSGKIAEISDPAYSLFEDASGRIWAGMWRNGLYMKEPSGEWTRFTVKDGLSDNSLSVLSEDIDGNIWAGSYRGVSLFKQGTWHAFQNIPDYTVYALTPCKKGGVWVGSCKGVFRMDADGKVRETWNMDNSSILSDVILSLAEDEKGRSRIWADIELFDFEGDVYSSPAVSATFDRLLVQLEDVSPFVERIAVYQYCGMLSKPGSTAATDHPSAERLYKDYRRWLDAQHWL